MKDVQVHEQIAIGLPISKSEAEMKAFLDEIEKKMNEERKGRT